MRLAAWCTLTNRGIRGKNLPPEAVILNLSADAVRNRPPTPLRFTHGLTMTIIDTPRHTNAVGYPGSGSLAVQGAAQPNSTSEICHELRSCPMALRSLFTIRRLNPVAEVIFAPARRDFS